MIAIRGKIEEQDFVRAQWLHLKPRPWLMGAGIVILALGILLGAFYMLEWFRGRTSASGPLLLPLLLFALPLYYGILDFRFRRWYRRHKLIQAPVEIELTEERFQGRSEHGETQIPWELFARCKEGKHTFLIYQSGSLFHLLPKRLFVDPGDVERAGELRRSKVGVSRSDPA